MGSTKIQSVEPQIADLVNGWMKSYGLDYKLEQESLNSQIDKALEEYASKSGGSGGNRPDAKLLLKDKYLKDYPILIEYKGYKDKLVKLDSNGQVENRSTKNEPLYKNINSYAVNGAIHYANAVLHYTNYSDIISIGVTGNKDQEGNLDYSIGVYYVSKSNFGMGQRVGEYSDLSFLKSENFDEFIETVRSLSLTPKELDKLKEKREQEIDASLVRLNNDIYQNEQGLGESDRVYLVAASIMATIGIPNKISPLEKSDLRSTSEDGNRDGDIIVRKIEAFLKAKEIPSAKQEMIVRTLKNTLCSDNINKVENGESQLKRVFVKIIDDLGIYYKIGLTTDFTGKLFNEMYSWLGFSQDKLNDVVLTPSYVASLLVKLARVDRNSYVWDFATGSAGLLLAAMNEMLDDAKSKIKSPDEYNKKCVEIKAKQLLGIEILPSVYMLAVLNMILMGDGSSNILNRDSLKDFEGKYEYTNVKDEYFPANAFVLNPPYSAPGNGMIFVEKALSMMNKGYAAIIIQNSAGSGKATSYNKKILKHSTLLASIKMPDDLFVGKSSVQTRIYVFRVGEAHNNNDPVRFIDFTNDGYTRRNRKKASCNLRDTDNAKERYQELIDLVRAGKSKLNYFTEKEYYEGFIDSESGADWNQTAPIDTTPALTDFKKTVGEYLSSEISNILNNNIEVDKILRNISKSNLDLYSLSEKEKIALLNYEDLEWKDFNLLELYGPSTRGKRLKSEDRIPGDLPFVTAGESFEGVSDYIGNKVEVFSKNTTTIDMFGSAKYRNYDYGGDDHVAVVHTEPISKYAAIFVTSAIHKASHTGKFNYGNNFYAKDADALWISLPAKENEPDYDTMSVIVSAIHKILKKDVMEYICNKISEE